MVGGLVSQLVNTLYKERKNNIYIVTTKQNPREGGGIVLGPTLIVPQLESKSLKLSRFFNSSDDF